MWQSINIVIAKAKAIINVSSLGLFLMTSAYSKNAPTPTSVIKYTALPREPTPPSGKGMIMYVSAEDVRRRSEHSTPKRRLVKIGIRYVSSALNALLMIIA